MSVSFCLSVSLCLCVCLCVRSINDMALADSGRCEFTSASTHVCLAVFISRPPSPARAPAIYFSARFRFEGLGLGFRPELGLWLSAPVQGLGV
jgi:hypothetical protein